ncbi:uncharacterized protein SCHCODRAFT_02609181 [Schizophyllum commune H4-8]|nr:uncharacterized protein SCHCODRAFT_02609181 [Schizophyllum commune H4-8]KAI5897369.1 hypothetical protein SCHCODRAFT_02609181 [Schizophyllum commune H4-8]
MRSASNEEAHNSCFLPGFPPPSEAMCRPAVGNRHSPPLPPLPDFAKFLGYTATALPSSPPPQTTRRRRRRQLTQGEAEQTTDIRHQRQAKIARLERALVNDLAARRPRASAPTPSRATRATLSASQATLYAIAGNSLPTQQGDSRYGISVAFLSGPRRRCFGTALRSCAAGTQWTAEWITGPSNGWRFFVLSVLGPTSALKLAR